MMSLGFELARELREKGFPNVAKNMSNEEVVGRYFLSAEGNSYFKCLSISHNGFVNWNAFQSYPQTLPISQAHRTPEEAVANLWLGLNYANTKTKKGF